MRVVLDHCVPQTLRRHIPGHAVRTVGELGWSDVDDGPLLDFMAGHCEAFITADRNLSHQQRLDHRSFGTVILHARTNRLADLAPLAPGLLVVLSDLRPGQVAHVGI